MEYSLDVYPSSQLTEQHQELQIGIERLEAQQKRIEQELAGREWAAPGFPVTAKGAYAAMTGGKSNFVGMDLVQLLAELEDLFWRLSEQDQAEMPEEVAEALTVLGSLY